MFVEMLGDARRFVDMLAGFRKVCEQVGRQWEVYREVVR